MKYWVGRSLLVTLLIGSVFGLKSLWQTISGARETPCVPFAQKEVPDENDGTWKLIYEYQDDVNKVRGYKTKTGLHLGIYEVFGTFAFKAWACRPNGERGDMPDHMIALLSSGRWYVANVQAPVILAATENGTKDGKIISVKIKLVDKAGKVLAERTINRPK